MDLFELSITVALVLVSFAAVVPLFGRKSGDEARAKLPPGSFGWPVFGETIDFLFGGKPEKFVLDRMRKYSPDIFKTRLLGEKTAVICGHNGHKFLFSNDQKLFTVFRPHPMQHLFRSVDKSQSSPTPRAVQTPEDQKKKIIRQPGFLKPEALIRFLGIMDATADHLLKAHWRGKDVVQAHTLSKIFTLTLSCRYFLGVENPERIVKLVDHLDDIALGMHAVMWTFPGMTFYRAKKGAAAVRKELVSVVREKKTAIAGGQPMKDILSHLILATDPSGKSVPEAEIAGKIMGLIIAGYTTVAATITFLMKYVGERPDIYHKIRAEQMEIASSKKEGEMLEWEDMQKMKYSWNVICETMRMNPPIQGTFREALSDFTYAGYTVPKGWKVYWTPSSTNKNPAYFKDPQVFDPSRYGSEGGAAITAYAFLPFGSGPTMCPGKEYARLAILAFLHNLVKQFSWEVLIPNEKIIGDMMPTPEKRLPLRLHPFGQ